MRDRKIIALRLNTLSHESLGLAVKLRDIGFAVEASRVSTVASVLSATAQLLANKDFLEDPR